MLDKKTKLIYKTIIAVSALTAFGFAVAIAVFLFSGTKIPDFFDKWGVFFILIFMGISVFFMMQGSQTKYQGGDSRDQFMLVVLVLLVLSAILSVIMAYTGLFSLGKIAG